MGQTKVYECPEDDCDRMIMIDIRENSYPNETVYCDCGTFPVMEVVHQ